MNSLVKDEHMDCLNFYTKMDGLAKFLDRPLNFYGGTSR